MIKILNKVSSFTLRTSQKEWVLTTGVSQWKESEWGWFSVAQKDIALALKTKRVEILKDKSSRENCEILSSHKTAKKKEKKES